MNRLGSLALLSFAFSSAHLSAQAFSFSRATPEYRYCAKQWGDFQSDFSSTANRIQFENSGGLANAGVCWWHSRMQRSLLYLSVFNNPSGPKPTESQIESILDTVAANRRVVEISGYANIDQFTRDPLVRRLMLKKLESWQIVDGFVKQEWIRGLSGSATPDAKVIEEQLDFLAIQTSTHGLIPYSMLQIQGVMSHAWLVTKVVKVPASRKLPEHYVISFVDSNYPRETFHNNYYKGQTAIRFDSYEFGIYTHRQVDFVKIEKAQESYCGARGLKGALRAFQWYEIQEPKSSRKKKKD